MCSKSEQKRAICTRFQKASTESSSSSRVTDLPINDRDDCSTLSQFDTDYISVESGEEKDTKGLKLLRSMVSMNTLKLKPVTTRLVWSGQSSSSANTAQAPVINVDPYLSSEFSSYAALYQECKVMGGSVMYIISSTGGSVTALPSFSVICYNTMENTALSNIVSGLTHTSKKLVGLQQTSDVTPRCVNSDGFHRFTFKCPTESQANTSDLTNVVGLWSGTNETAALYGFLKSYIPALGSGVVSTISYFVDLDIKFRQRE